MVSEIVPVFDAFFKVYTVYSVKEADRGVVFFIYICKFYNMSNSSFFCKLSEFSDKVFFNFNLIAAIFKDVMVFFSC